MKRTKEGEPKKCDSIYVKLFANVKKLRKKVNIYRFIRMALQY